VNLLTDNAYNIAPQVLSDVTTDADEGLNYGQHKCEDNYEFWIDNKAWCKARGWIYSGGGSTTKTCRRLNCEGDKEYFLNNRSCCEDNYWYYDSHGPTYLKHKCEDNWSFWINNMQTCRDHGWRYEGPSGADNYKDAGFITDIFTGMYDEDFQDENIQDKDVQEEDIKDDLEESQVE
jgi:hypothetical protein